MGTASDYDVDIPYALVFTKELAPAWLDHVALIAGFQPPARARSFAWCDLGCGQGLSAAIFAATHPGARFYAIDAVPMHIDHAQRLAKEADIRNLSLYAADFAAAVDFEFDGFDYIVAHGIYSWVDEKTQANIRRLIDRHLKPGGLVYLSYNAMPGRAPDLPFQQLVRALARTLPGDDGITVAAALEIVRRFTALEAPALMRSPMANWLKDPAHGNPAYLAHEIMVQNWTPLCVNDVRASMRMIDLEPVGSAKLLENFESLILAPAARDALAAIADIDIREFVKGFLLDQAFRCDVFIRRGRRLDSSERENRLLDSAFMLTRPPSTVKYEIITPAGPVTFDSDWARRVVAGFAPGPGRLAEIARRASIGPKDAVEIALTLSASGILRPVEPSRTSVERLNEAIHRRLGGSEGILNLALPCGTALTTQDLAASIRPGALAGDIDWNGWADFLAVFGLDKT